MEVVVTTGAISRAKLQSNHHQQTNIQFFTGRMPFLYGQSFYRTLIGNHLQSIEWYHFQWPWVTSDSDFKVTTFLKSNIGYLKDKVTIAQEEKYLTYGMVLFVDLDWPLNASRGFVSISWASCWTKIPLVSACDMGYLCANFSLPRPLCSRLRPNVRDKMYFSCLFAHLTLTHLLLIFKMLCNTYPLGWLLTC